MTWLAESALSIWVAGAVALTLAWFVFFHTRSPKALVGLAIVAVLMATALLLAHFIETPREAVERTLYELAQRVEANDVAGALSYLAPSATPALRNEIERQMPQVKIERARVIGTPQIDIHPDEHSATVKCRGLIIAVVKQNGMKGGAEDEVTLEFVRNGDLWQVDAYASKRNWDRALGR